MDESPTKARSTLELLRDRTPRNEGELAWRLGMAFAALNFVLLAVTVSSVNPRVGRSGNLVFALFAFVVYFNLLNLGTSWIASGRVPFGPFMLLLHGGTFLAAALWLGKQHNNWAVRPLLRRLRGRPACRRSAA
jgi:lipopolysaccharide export system permease protein